MANFYEKLDSALVYGANKLVRGWNWTTGSTKGTLGNSLVLTAPFVEGYGLYIVSPTNTCFFVSALITATGISIISNIKQEREEMRLLDKMVKANYRYEKLNESTGFVFGLLALADSIPLGNTNDSYFETVAVGNGIRSMSHYIMRADPLPPRKNCLSRGLDKLSEFIEGYKRREAIAIVHAVGG